MASHLTSFHLFPQLPPEIRLRIWDLNLPCSRLVPIHCGYDPSDVSQSRSLDFGKRSYNTTSETTPTAPLSSPSDALGNPSACFSPASIPANLHTCLEARQHALSTRYSHSLSFARAPGRVLLDHESDVVYFPPREGYMAASSQFHTCLSLCHPSDLARIRRVALHESLFSCSPSPSSPPPSGSSESALSSPSSSPPRQRRHPSSTSSVAAAGPNGPNYWSGLAVSLTVECLRRLKDRMPAVEEIIFVCTSPDPDAMDCDGRAEPPARLVAQIQTAMADLTSSLDGEWSPPQWTVVAEPR